MSTDFSERDIHLALDGELPAERMRDYGAWLDANPEMKVKAARFEADRQRLRTALGPVAYEAVPGRLTRTIISEIAAPSIGRSWLRNAVAAALVVGAGVGGYMLGVSGGVAGLTGPGEPVAERAVTAHRIYAAEKLHVVEVGADQKDHLVGWLSKRVGTQLTAPDLVPEGFSLVGGRLLPSGEKVAAQFMYQDQTGNRVSLYVTPASGREETGFRRFEEADGRAFYWLDGGYGYAVAGGVPDQTMEAVARAAYRQLLPSQSRG